MITLTFREFFKLQNEDPISLILELGIDGKSSMDKNTGYFTRSVKYSNRAEAAITESTDTCEERSSDAENDATPLVTASTA